MQYDEVILGRRSTRGFKKTPVPKSLIQEVIALAIRAPSSLNTQPWKVLRRCRRRNDGANERVT